MPPGIRFPPSGALRKTSRIVWLRVCLFLAVFTGIFGQKLALIRQYGGNVPFWDAWDAEEDLLFKPYMEGHLPVSVWIRPHNEHRILFTRAWALGLFIANGDQWDGSLELVANAALHAFAIALLVGLATTLVPPLVAVGLGAMAVYLAGSPVDNENTLAGFQSQFYFLLLIPGLHLWLSVAYLKRPRLCWIAAACGLAALFTMASGFFSAAALVGVCILRFLRERRVDSDGLRLLVPNVVLAGLGWCLKVDIAAHESLRPTSAGAWFDSFLHQLSWPAGGLWFAPIAAAALLTYLAAYFRGKLNKPQHLFLLGAGIWVWFQYAAIAYARGGSNFGYASRYTDLLEVALIVNTLLFAVVSLNACASRVCYGVAGAGLLYATLVLWNYQALVAESKSQILPGIPALNAARAQTVRQYVATKDLTFFEKKPWDELPYPEAHRLASLLDDPTIRATLPFSLRPPLPVDIDGAASSGFEAYRQDGPAGIPPHGLSAFDSGLLQASSTDSHLETTPFTADRGRVSVWLAGTANEVTAWLDQDGRRMGAGTQSALSPSGWSRMDFSVPKGDYRLCLTMSGSGWVAVTGPVIDGRLSGAAVALSRQNLLFDWIAWICGALAVGLALTAVKSLDSSDAPEAA